MTSAARSRGEDQDAIHLLPLFAMPLKMRSLKEARLVKNSCLQGVVELFSGEGGGSGQLHPDGLGEAFDFSGERKADLEVIRSLCALPSYDVYSLRLGFRDLGISVEDKNFLRLSDDKSRDLMKHMNVFTRPLICRIYGKDEAQNRSLKEIVQLFLDPDMKQARANLERLADSLGIGLMDIPIFLERYADVYLSLAYYAAAIEEVTPPLRRLSGNLQRIREDSRYAQNRPLVRRLNEIELRLTEAENSITYVLEIFRQRTETMWEDIDGASFRAMERLIMDYQRSIGANLCALVVKMDAWERLRGKASLTNCVQFIMSEISPGIELMPPMDMTMAEAPLVPIPAPAFRRR